MVPAQFQDNIESELILECHLDEEEFLDIMRDII